MSELPKKTKRNWSVVATVVGSLFFLTFAFVSIFGPGQGGRHLGAWTAHLLFVLAGFFIIKANAARKIRSEVKFEAGDADIFTNGWYDLLSMVAMGVIVNIFNALIVSPINLYVEIALFIPFYFIYRNIFELPELELYAKYNKVKKVKKGKEA